MKSYDYSPYHLATGFSSISGLKRMDSLQENRHSSKQIC